MTERKIYIGSFGPFVYDDADDIDDRDGDFAAETLQAIRSNGAGGLDGDFVVGGDLDVSGSAEVTGSISAASFALADTDASHHLSLTWNEDDSADRVLNLLVAGGDRSLTLNESFTIGDGSVGTLTFGSVCTLTVELASILNQDLTTDASPAFANLGLGTGELTTGSINRAAEALTLEIGGIAVISIYATAVLVDQTLSLTDCPHLDADPDKFLVLEPNDQVYYRTGAEVLSDIGAAVASHAMSTHSDEDTYDILTSGTLGAGNATLGTVNALTLTTVAVGFTIAGGTTPKTLTVDDNFVVSTQLAAISANTGKISCTFTNVQTALAAASGAVAFNSQNLTGVGTIGCGAITTSGLFTLNNDIKTDRWEGSATNFYLGQSVVGGGHASGATYNMFIGYSVAYELTSGDYNIALGANAARSLDDGINNICIGYASGYYNQGGQWNIFIGKSAGQGTSVGDYHQNIFIGGNAGLKIAAGGNVNTGIGYSVLSELTTGGNNVAIGGYALFYNSTGARNVAIGYVAGQGSAGNSHSYNVFIASHAGFNIQTSSNNVGIGYYSLYALTTGDGQNTVIGAYAFNNITTGQYNVGIGYRAGRYAEANSTENVCIGYYAGYGVNGNVYNYNTLIGSRAGYYVTTGSNNVCVGYQAGDVITSGSGNIIIGQGRDPSTADVSNEINIGGVYKGDTGTTVPKFGTYTALGAEVLAGYITIKDLAGNDRKIAVIA